MLGLGLAHSPPYPSSRHSWERGGWCLPVSKDESHSRWRWGWRGGRWLLTLPPAPPGRAAPTCPWVPPTPCLTALTMLNGPPWRLLLLLWSWGPLLRRAEVRTPRSPRTSSLGGRPGDGFKCSPPTAEGVLRLPHLSRFKLFPISLLSPSNSPDDFQPFPRIFPKVFNPAHLPPTQLPGLGTPVKT